VHGRENLLKKGSQLARAAKLSMEKELTLLKDRLFNRDGSFIAGMNQRAVAARGGGTLCPHGRQGLRSRRCTCCWKLSA